MAVSEPSAVRASGLRHGRVAAAIFATGVVLAVLAVPQLLAAIARVGGDTVVAGLAEGHQPTPQAASWAARSRVAATRWWPLPEDIADISLLEIVDARSMDPATQAGQRRLKLDRAVGRAREALAVANGNPFIWMRLAEAMFLRDGIAPGVADALVMSMERGPTVQALVLPRLEMAFVLDSVLTEEQRAVVNEQIRLAALWQPEWLVASTRRRYALAIVRAGLQATPERLAQFNEAWDRTR